MTVSKTQRLGLTRWSDEADPWLRSDWDLDNAQLEALAAMAEAGTLAARPAAAKSGRFYYDAADDSIYYDTGTKWVTVTRANSDGTYILATNITASGDGNTVSRRNGMAALALGFTNSGGTVTGNTSLGTVPAGYRPTRPWPIFLRTNATGSTAQANIATSGLVSLVSGSSTYAVNTVFTGAVSYPHA